MCVAGQDSRSIAARQLREKRGVPHQSRWLAFGPSTIRTAFKELVALGFITKNAEERVNVFRRADNWRKFATAQEARMIAAAARRAPRQPQSEPPQAESKPRTLSADDQRMLRVAAGKASPSTAYSRIDPPKGPKITLPAMPWDDDEK